MSHQHSHEHGADHAQGSRHGHHHGGADDFAGSIEMLDLDGRVLSAYWDAVLAWVASQVTARPVRRIVDVGAGTGNASLRLAALFPDASVVALDVAPPLLARIGEKASEAGLGDRVSPVEADLDVAWPDLGVVDLSWASLSLHHLAEPDDALRRLHAATAPGGLLAIAEMAAPVRFLPPDTEAGRIEDRLLALAHAEYAAELPDLGSEWSPRIAAAGFTVLDERAFDIDVPSSQAPELAAYARSWLQRASGRLGGPDGGLDTETAAALAELVDGSGPESLAARGDLRAVGVRTVTVARRD